MKYIGKKNKDVEDNEATFKTHAIQMEKDSEANEEV